MTRALPGTAPSVRIDGLRRTVSDLRRSIDFYCGALGFEPVPGTATASVGVRLRLGDQHIDLRLAEAPMPPGARAPDPRFQHAAIVAADMDAAWKRLASHGAASISRDGPQTLPAHTGGVTAFKFRDPDGHPLELIQFPAGVGDPRWQAKSGGPTLGIDHFAMVVAAVDASTTFLAARLGLRLAARDVNRGIEQDRLDGLDGVVVDVVSLEPAHGPRTPHIELLRYRHPVFESADTVGSAEPGADEIVCLGSGRQHAGANATAVRDPDGHRFLLDLD